MNPILSAILRVALHSCGLAVTWLPRALELALGRALGKVLFLVDFKRKKIGLENMKRCLPELGPAGWDRLLRANYEHYGMLALEFMHMFSPVPGHWPAYVRRWTRVEGFEHFKSIRARGKGALWVTAHMGNWEMGAAVCSMDGIDALMITRRLKPLWLHRWMEARRNETKIDCAFQPRTVPAVLKQLRRGGSVGFVMDQYMPPPMGIPVPFFGTVVDTLAAVGSLSMRTGAGVITATQIRGEDGVIRVILDPEVDFGDAAGDQVEMTKRLANETERMIRLSPEQWLWVHRRFKNLPTPSGTVSPTKA